MYLMIYGWFEQKYKTLKRGILLTNIINNIMNINVTLFYIIKSKINLYFVIMEYRDKVSEKCIIYYTVISIYLLLVCH